MFPASLSSRRGHLSWGCRLITASAWWREFHLSARSLLRTNADARLFWCWLHLSSTAGLYHRLMWLARRRGDPSAGGLAACVGAEELSLIITTGGLKDSAGLIDSPFGIIEDIV